MDTATTAVHNLCIGTQLSLLSAKALYGITNYRKSNAHAHSWPWKESPTALSHTCWLLRVAREHLQVVGCHHWAHTLSLPSPPGSMWEWWSSNTPVTHPCVFDHEMHIMICMIFITVQIRMNTVQCHASHKLCTYIYVHWANGCTFFIYVLYTVVLQ